MKKYHCKLAITLLFISSISHGLTLKNNDFSITIEPETLKIAHENEVINKGIQQRTTQKIKATDDKASWYWPDRQMNVSARLEGQQLRLRFTTSQVQTFFWYQSPKDISALYMPLGEGSHIPTDNIIWQQYLLKEQNGIDTNYDLKLPLWSQQQNRVYSWLLINPFNNKINFSTQSKQLHMSSGHIFDQFNLEQPFDVILSVGNSPIDGALAYRQYLESIGEIKTLREKFTYIHDGYKLIGATHIYVWGKGLLDQQDIKDWQGLSQYLQSSSGKRIWQALEKDAQIAFKKITLAPPEEWQRPYLTNALNNAFQRIIPNSKAPYDAEFLQHQQMQAQKIKRFAALQLGPWLTASQNWGQGLSIPLINQLNIRGLDRIWLGVDNWVVTFYQSQAVDQALELGYLIGSYDSYDTGIPAGVNDQWLTAQIPFELRKKCAIVQKNGQKLPGFGGQGYYLNPGCMLNYSKNRIKNILELSHTNSLFLDVDGTAMVTNDYHPENRTSAQQMAQARNTRLEWIEKNLRIPLGSEDGNALTAKHLMFAHGMETWGFGWGDQSIHKDKNSPYYLGAWWPESEPATFFKKAKLKQPYLTVEFDPRWRLPLYQAVFHDTIISTHHWTFDNLKFPEVQTTRELLSQLYNTAPLYNLSRNTIQKRLPDILRSNEVYRPLHEVLWDKKMVGFQWLDNEGWVQKTTFSDGTVIMANFSKQAFNDLPPQSLKAILASGRVIQQSY
ncbi:MULTISPECIES: glycoside hydrolase [unclassified Providencia]|uniref:glycoside hydrolase n=1 Tax=unclassified Providencia TaxID=2633465 RepID=UPI0012B51B06|nr:MULTISPECIES: glycoside hydrolase [unclassified Providencia]MTB39377.1 hypothetical protein [Providencia sp. wls1949]MTC07805.1 hypothetical protein [Providencia sp. wls1948]